MEIEGEGLDAVLIDLYEAILKSGTPNSSTAGDTVELLGVTLRISKPRARVSRSFDRGRPFSAIGELLWYLSGRDDAAYVGSYIPFYVKEGKPEIVNGAYGPRIRTRHGFDQLEEVARMMQRKDGSRRSVIQLYEAADLLTDLDVPCTLALQFQRRGTVLHMTVMMRSNDAYFGVPHDVFCFTMLQELVAAELGLEVGEYVHMVGSMHLYTKHLGRAQNYINEGYQRAAEMPPMPKGGAFQKVRELLEFELMARDGQQIDAREALGDPYWADLGRLVQINFAKTDETIEKLSSEMHNIAFHSAIEDQRDRIASAQKAASDTLGE